MRLILLILFSLNSSSFAQTNQTLAPNLPLEVMAEVKALEETITKALSSLTSKKVALYALPIAEKAYQLRRKYQGDKWWETIDRRVQLEVLMRATSLSGDAEKRLMEANRLEQEIESARDPLEAERALRKLAAIEVEIYGAESIWTANTLSNLAWNLHRQGKYKLAEPLLRQSLEIQEHVTGKNHPEYADKLSNLASNIDSQGRYVEAEKMFREALERLSQFFDAKDKRYGKVLSQLSFNLHSQGRNAEAGILLKKFVETQKAAVTQKDRIASALSADQVASLQLFFRAWSLQTKKQYAEAEPLLRQALGLVEKLAGKMDPVFSQALAFLALNLRLQGKNSEAEPLVRQALEIQETGPGKEHPLYPRLLNELAWISASNPARHGEAAGYWIEAGRRERLFVGSSVAMTSSGQSIFSDKEETTQKVLPSTLKWRMPIEKRRLVVEELLLTFAQRMDRDREANAAMRRIFPTAPGWWKETWEDYLSLRREIGESSIGGFEGFIRGETTHKLLIDRAELLEAKLRNYPPFVELAKQDEVGLKQMNEALNLGQAAIQFSLYRQLDFAADPNNRWGETAYLALILRPGLEPVHVSLSSKNVIDAAVRELQRVHRVCIDGTKLENAELPTEWWQDCEKRVAAAGSRVRELVWDPLKEHLKDSRRVYIAAGGMLGLVPFEMLPAKQSVGLIRYLVEDKEFVYLNSLRELAVFSRRRDPLKNQTAVVVANPRFDATPIELVQKNGAESATLASIRKNRSTLGGSMLTGGKLRTELPRNWPPIEEAQFAEKAVELLQMYGWKVERLLGSQATEDAVTAVKAPRLLQIATHGYVLDPPKDQPEQSPMLRSMLMLAGVNKSAKGDGVYRIGQEYLTEEQARARNISDEELSKAKIDLGDGVLTAYEAQGMDLFGTELVNLTACETGLGAVNADGVAGLRQAFMNAGARSITMSLFEILELESTKQMAQFYENWLGQKMTRYKAFRAAQLQALESARKNEKTGHPFFWAGIVFAGDPGDLPLVTK
jgi:CHAT domain-containing protein/tetratricopeptide (TPR) repeat protein